MARISSSVDGVNGITTAWRLEPRIMNERQSSQPVDESRELSDLLHAGDENALGRLLERYRDRLLRIVQFRMDPRLNGRIDADDVVQEAFLEATQRIAGYVDNPSMPFFLWLRFITVQKLAGLHRHHFDVQARDREREVSLTPGRSPGGTSADLAARLLGSQTSPSLVAARAETLTTLENALNSMDETDREVLSLRHFEQLSNLEVAEVLELSPTAASNRYVRAVRRLREIMTESGNGSAHWQY